MKNIIHTLFLLFVCALTSNAQQTVTNVLDPIPGYSDGAFNFLKMNDQLFYGEDSIYQLGTANVFLQKLMKVNTNNTVSEACRVEKKNFSPSTLWHRLSGSNMYINIVPIGYKMYLYGGTSGSLMLKDSLPYTPPGVITRTQNASVVYIASNDSVMKFDGNTMSLLCKADGKIVQMVANNTSVYIVSTKTTGSPDINYFQKFKNNALTTIDTFWSNFGTPSNYGKAYEPLSDMAIGFHNKFYHIDPNDVVTAYANNVATLFHGICNNKIIFNSDKLMSFDLTTKAFENLGNINFGSSSGDFYIVDNALMSNNHLYLINYDGNKVLSSNGTAAGSRLVTVPIRNNAAGNTQGSGLLGSSYIRAMCGDNLIAYFLDSSYVTRYYMLKPDTSHTVFNTFTGETGDKWPSKLANTSTATYSVHQSNGSFVNKKIVKLNSCNGAVSTNEIIKNNASVVVYPNPTTDMIRISLEGLTSYSTATITIIDASGKSVATTKMKITQQQETVPYNVSSLSAGLYYISVRQENGIVLTQKFSKL
jgi:hypothetical protein